MSHLHHQTSPYLLQHADNPVDWYPWCAEALQKAREENKPILLSIGYAACHWCHVMARESFADAATAALMNQWFINIKVDREERPDLDKLYQTAHQLLTGRAGGWPLTVFLTPDKQIPFYAGTYFPVTESFGRPGFKTVLNEIAHFYYQRTDAIERVTKALTTALAKITETSTQGVVLDQAPLSALKAELESSFDFIHGGFGRAPKFPLATHLESLLQMGYFTRDPAMLKMLSHSLIRMAQGGFCDQLGGGFFRYTVDGNWMIPHFEKMLYDNAQLIPLYAILSVLNQDTWLQSVALAAVAWAVREMRDPDGGFYATLNADSEGIEGKYYYWERDEIRKILTRLEYSAVVDYFGLNQPPNFEGHWHLFIATQDESIHGEWLAIAKEKLLAAREQRVHPSCDKKILTSWNALMIKGLVKTARLFSKTDLLTTAQTTLEFIRQNLWQNNRLLAVYSGGHAHLSAYLDDYVFLLDAILEYLQWQWRSEYFQWAQTLAEHILQHFYDADGGGFFYTADDHEQLIQRLKLFGDEAMPSGNGIAVLCLLRLGYMLGEQRYLTAAEKTLQAAFSQLSSHPSAYDTMLRALYFYFNPPVTIFLRGESDSMTTWQQAFSQHYLPDHACYALPSDLTDLPTALQKPIPTSGVTATICQGAACRTTMTSLSEFTTYLNKI